MTHEITAILDRIEADMALLRQTVVRQSGQPTISSYNGNMKNTSLAVPVPKNSYTQAEAAIEKSKIEDAYLAGLITWDKKRGLKMLVTKCTEGWVPDKRSLRHEFRAPLTAQANALTTPQPSSGEGSTWATVPALKSSYTHAEAATEKSRMNDAYLAGLITSDKKRGLKMLVTKSTDGWAPRATNALTEYVRHSGEQRMSDPVGTNRGMQMTDPPRSRDSRSAGFKSVTTKGQEELDRAGAEAAWTKANCAKGTRDVVRNPYSRQNFYPPGHQLHPR